MKTLSKILAEIVLLTASFSMALGQEVKVAPKLRLQAEAKTVIRLKVDAPIDAKQNAKAFRIELNAEPQAVQVKAKAEVLMERNGERIRIVEAPNVSWNPNNASNNNEASPEKIDTLDSLRLFDGSQLKGQLIELTGNRLLQWENESAANPLSFRFSAVDSIVLAPRTAPEKKQIGENAGKVLIKFTNGDRLRGQLHEIDGKTVAVQTDFAGVLKTPREKISSIILLPPSHQSLYDASYGFSGWKASSKNAWRYEDGGLVTSASGSMSRLLPEKEAVEIEFQASWERSFYFRVQMFSDNRSTSSSSRYGSIGYDFSFSNNRLNLQVAKRKKGRLTRETIGSAEIKDLLRMKTARFRIFGNRKSKKFGVWVNDRKMASWKDGDEEFIPIGNTVSFYNQGGSSFLRLNETSICGWEGDYTPVEEPAEKEKKTTQVTLVNGDSTASEIGTLVDGNLQLKTKRGTFNTPVERIRSIYFPQKKELTTKPSSERIWLTGSSGNLALNLKEIRNGIAKGENPNFGLVEISISRVRRLSCNIHLLELEKYLAQLRLARKALDDRNLENANQILQKTNPAMRGWLWGRLAFHAKALSSSEILSFAPHPESGLAGAEFAEDSETILTVGKDATFGLWNGHARLVSGKIKGSESLHGELGRFPNETQRFTTISRDFWLGQFELTQEQYEKLVGENPSTRKSPKFSVEKTSWFDAAEYCKLLNKKFPPGNGYVHRLPTEAEWEYACRAGSTGPFTGSSIASIPNDDIAYSEHLSKIAWFSGNSNNAPHAGGKKDANAFGLHDMHGNLWEWCLDHVELNKQNMLKSRVPGAVDPFVTKGRWRSLRGGSFNVGFNRCRSAYRGANDPGVKRDDRGFRVALAPDLSPDANSTKVKIEKPYLIQELGLRLMPIPAGSFLLGSPEKLPGGCAVSVPKTDLILTGNVKGELYLSDLAGRTPRSLGQKLPSAVTAMAASPEGKHLLAGCSDGSTHLLSLSDGKKIASFSDHKSPVTTVAFSPKEDRVASSELAGKAVIRKPDPKINPVFLKGHSARFDNIDFSPDGTRVITSGPGAPPALWNSADGAFLLYLRIELDDVVTARFAPDGQGVSVACRSGRILFCETTTGLTYNRITLPGRELADLHYSPEGNRMLVVTQEGLCSIRSIPQAEAIRIVEKDGSLTSSPDYYFDLARHNASPSSLPSTLETFLRKHGQMIDGETLPKSCTRSPDNAWILTTTDGALRLWRSETGKLEANLAEKLSAPFETCAFSPDGLFATGRLTTGQILAYPAFPQSYSAKPDLLPTADVMRSWFNSSLPR